MMSVTYIWLWSGGWKRKSFNFQWPRVKSDLEIISIQEKDRSCCPCQHKGTALQLTSPSGYQPSLKQSNCTFKKQNRLSGIWKRTSNYQNKKTQSFEWANSWESEPVGHLRSRASGLWKEHCTCSAICTTGEKKAGSSGNHWMLGRAGSVLGICWSTWGMLTSISWNSCPMLRCSDQQ